MTDWAFLDVLASDEAVATLLHEDMDEYRRRLDEFLGIEALPAGQGVMHGPPPSPRRSVPPIGDRCRLIEGDCLGAMRDLRPVDLILADLPFGLTNAPWDRPLDLGLFWEAVVRVARPTTPVVLFAAQPFTTDLIGSNKGHFRYLWYWYKGKASNFLNAKYQPMKMVEEVCVFSRRRSTYNPQMRPLEEQSRRKLYANSSEMFGKLADLEGLQARYGGHRSASERYPTNILGFKAVPRKGRVHSAQKPVPLLEYLIETYTNEGDTVLDCCMGSGSTGVACMRTNRKFIGIEKDRDIFKAAAMRIEDAAREAGPSAFREAARPVNNPPVNGASVVKKVLPGDEAGSGHA